MTRRTLSAALLTTAAGATLAITAGLGFQSYQDTSAVPEELVITGVIRDFKTSHPDMEAFPGSGTKRLVKAELGQDGKPVFNDALLSEGRSWGKDIQVAGLESFNQWFRDVPGVNVSWQHSITLQRQSDGKYVFAKERPEYFWPADGKGYGASEGPLRWASPGTRNFHFTYEIETEFTYTSRDNRDSDLVFKFVGDDDVWVYINGKLAVDLGGVHSQQSASVNLDQKAAELGLEPGGRYQLKLFFAERHTSESNFRVETNFQLRTVNLPETSALYD